MDIRDCLEFRPIWLVEPTARLEILNLGFPRAEREVGRGAFLAQRSQVVRLGGVLRSENAGISSKKSGENPDHRKPKVSWALMISPGLGDPKV